MTPEILKIQLERELPGATVAVEGNGLLIQPKDLPAVGKYLRDHQTLRLDFLSHVTGVDYLKEGYLEAVYYLYSVANKHGPVVLRVRVPRDNPKLPSAVPIWRGAEFQEREAYDLYGFQFEGHPDLRRILMWDEFVGHPMRKDYVPEDQDEPNHA